MHRSAITRLRSVRLPRGRRTLLTAAAVTAAVVPTAQAVAAIPAQARANPSVATRLSRAVGSAPRARLTARAMTKAVR